MQDDIPTDRIEHLKIETNLPGLLILLAEGLYSEPDVFIRELVQNAHDAIVERIRIEKDFAGRIDVTYDPGLLTITVRDGGIGMDRSDITTFLSVIGSSSKLGITKAVADLREKAETDLIGQFGIGLLSAFVVSATVTITTRKLGRDESFLWFNQGTIDYELSTVDWPHTGTETTLHIRGDFGFLLDHQRLRLAIKKYCDFLPFPIYLNAAGPINTVNPPWTRTDWASVKEKEAAFRNFVNDRYPEIPLDVIPIDIGGAFAARGALFISNNRVPEFGLKGVVDIYVRHMFVRANDSSLLPPWARFIRGVVDSPDLKPTAARDSIKTDTPSFRFIQQKLAEAIIERLAYLAVNEPARFKEINLYHSYHIKGMAVEYDDFFDRVIDLLLFDTNQGFLHLSSYLGRNAARPETDNKLPIYYYSDSGAASQFDRIANARGWVVINAGGPFDVLLLKKYTTRNQQRVFLESLDDTDDPSLFGRLDADKAEFFRPLEFEIEGALRNLGSVAVSVRTREFAPPELPAVILQDPETLAAQVLSGMNRLRGLLPATSDLALEASRSERPRPLHLSLNASNPLILRLAGIHNLFEAEKACNIPRSDMILNEVILGIYNSAFLNSRDLLSRTNSEVIYDQMVRLFSKVLGYLDRLYASTTELQQLRRENQELRENHTQMSPDHILLFMITPFSDKFRNLELAVRRVFERSPYFFQVQLARDYQFKAELLDNVREHMLRAHGFIAELSELNPNVMFELGAIMQPNSERPVFSLRSAESVVDVPADLRQNLFLKYNSPLDPVDKIESDLRTQFEVDGRIVNDAVKLLLSARRTKFLSRTLLDSLKITLSQGQIDLLMRFYSTVEELLGRSQAEVAERCKIQPYLTTALFGELGEEA